MLTWSVSQKLFSWNIEFKHLCTRCILVGMKKLNQQHLAEAKIFWSAFAPSSLSNVLAISKENRNLCQRKFEFGTSKRIIKIIYHSFVQRKVVRRASNDIIHYFSLEVMYFQLGYMYTCWRRKITNNIILLLLFLMMDSVMLSRIEDESNKQKTDYVL